MNEIERDMPECEPENMDNDELKFWADKGDMACARKLAKRLEEEPDTVLGRMSQITRQKNELKRLMGLDEKHECYVSDARREMI